MFNRAIVLSFSIILLGLAPTARSHHADTLFDATRAIELVGKVVELRPSGPHATLIVEVRSGVSKIDARPWLETWKIELPPVGELVRTHGIDGTVFVAGDVVRVVAMPHRLPYKHEAKAYSVGKVGGGMYSFAEPHARLLSQISTL